MRDDDSELGWIQLAVKVPKELHRVVKLRCAETDMSITEFVAAAVREKLDGDASRRRAKSK